MLDFINTKKITNEDIRTKTKVKDVIKNQLKQKASGYYKWAKKIRAWIPYDTVEWEQNEDTEEDKEGIYQNTLWINLFK